MLRLPVRSANPMLVLYAIAIFVSAALLFAVQPIVGRLVVPHLGGSPAVWNTCMVFFQAALLAGYLYAHIVSQRLSRTAQLGLHAIVLIAAGLTLPIALRTLGAVPTDRSPVLWLIGTLVLSVGAPFLVLATTGPLLQRWFASTDHPGARDPYFLYAASNAGSFVALLGYPLAVEPALKLREQTAAWSVAFWLFAILAIGCGVLGLTRGRAAGPQAAGTAPAPGRSADPIPLVTPVNRLRWVLLAAVPSSLMLAVTQYFTTDIASIPLLWVVPLAIYLLTYILAFSKRQILPARSVARIVPIIAVGLTLTFLIEARRPASVLIALHLLGLFFMALLCHQRLAESRPPAARLTEFYLLLAVGGVLGGAFNSLVAPFLFDAVVEYPLGVVATCLFLPARAPARGRVRDRILLVALAGVGTAAYVAGVRVGFADALNRAPQAMLGLLFGVPLLGVYLLARWPARFAAALAVLLGMAVFYPVSIGRVLYTERTFFGVYRVAVSDTRDRIQLFHGTTIHGSQSYQRVSATGVLKPQTYYHPTGPIGRVFEAYREGPRLARVGLLGLGVGSLAAYARPGDRFTFFEIDPEVVRIAQKSRYFGFLSAAAGRYDVTLGDGRRSLERVPDGEFGLLVLDAFSSDAIPTHLITREAVELYRHKVAPDGLIAFHISNRYLDLRPVLAGIAHELGLVAYVCNDDFPGPQDRAIIRLGQQLERRQNEGAPREELEAIAEQINAIMGEVVQLRNEAKESSLWVVLTGAPANFEPLAHRPEWVRLEHHAEDPHWTDDYSNILGVFRWN